MCIFWKGKATGTEIVPAKHWVFVSQLIFCTSCYTATLSAAITSNWCPFPCTRIPSCRNFVGNKPNQDHLLGLRVTQPLLDLIAATMGNLQRWLILDHWTLNIGKEESNKNHKDTALHRIFKKHSLFFTNDILLFYASLFWKAYMDVKGTGRPSAWSTPFCH